MNKTGLHHFLPGALMIIAELIPLGHVSAQTFTTLHHFDGPDGGRPVASLLLSGTTLYGTTVAGGTIFRISTDGSSYAVLHRFEGSTAGLILSGTTLFGTTEYGGSASSGTVFRINTDGTGFVNLHSFTSIGPPTYGNADGRLPRGKLVLVGNTLMGTALRGGTYDKGTLFKVNTDGTGFANMHSFRGGTGNATTNDGSFPLCGMILSGSTLYGTTAFGSGADLGTVFKINTNGTGYAGLYKFSETGGVNPYAGLVLSGDRLYGTAAAGGSFRNGTVFALNIDGTGFQALHHFAATSPFGLPANSDGARPLAELMLSNNTLYGTARQGGNGATGTVFAVNIDGTGFTDLHSFTAISNYETSSNADGAYPAGGLILSGRTLFGTTESGGPSGYGTVFSLSLPPVSFAGWAAGFGLSGGAAAADANPDNDGLPNAAEYILGGNPTLPATSGRPNATASGGSMIFTFPRDDTSETPDVVLTVGSGTDLTAWPSVFSIGPDTAASSPGVSITENGTAPDTITVAIPIGSDETKFARLKVTITP